MTFADGIEAGGKQDAANGLTTIGQSEAGAEERDSAIYIGKTIVVKRTMVILGMFNGLVIAPYHFEFKVGRELKVISIRENEVTLQSQSGYFGVATITQADLRKIM